MGRYTDEKYEYDRLAAEYFRSKGYIAEITSGPGLADVVAYHPLTKRFVICEVKSPNEKDAHVSWETKYNLGGMSRRQVLELISREPGYKKNPGLWRLYSFTITSQLYTYYRIPDKHFGGMRLGKGNKTSQLVATYLAIPVSMRRVILPVIKCFAGKGFIKGKRIHTSGRFLVLSMTY